MKNIIVGIVILALIGAAVGGDDSDMSSSNSDKSSVVEPATTETASSASTDEEDEPEEPAAPAAEPDGEYELNCDYLLDFDESLNGNDNHKFVGGGTLTNTGNVGIKVRVAFKWRLLGQNPLIVKKTYKVKRNQEREINVTVPVTGEQIDAHQSADGDCDVKVKITDTFGTPK